jgi:hypothetical protein
MFSPTDLFHPPAPHFKTFQLKKTGNRKYVSFVGKNTKDGIRYEEIRTGFTSLFHFQCWCMSGPFLGM